jgi:hypothetical protein
MVRKQPLSEKPPAVRARMRKSSKNLTRDVEMLYKPVDEWDMEELARGRPRNRSGTFTGPRPTWISPLIIKEAQERLRVLTKQELSVFAGDAVRVIRELMLDDSIDDRGKPVVSDKVRMDAAKYVLDHTIGKPTNYVEVTGNVQLETLMATVLVNADGSPAHPVIDGQVVEDEFDDDEDGGN